MIESVKKYMKVPVKVYHFISYDGAGAKTLGTACEYKCLPNYKEVRVTNNKGKEVVSSIQLFMARTAVIDAEDVIEINDVLYDVKSLNGFYGSYSVGLWMVML